MTGEGESERSEGEVANTEAGIESVSDPISVEAFDALVDEALDEAFAEEAAQDEFESLFEEAAKTALSKEPRRRAGAADKRVPRPLSRWTDLKPQWKKVGFTLRVVRQECNCGSIHTIVEGLYRNDSGRREGESRMLRLTTEAELQDFSDDVVSPQWVETLTQGSVMCVDCASDYGFNVPASEQPAERAAPHAAWPFEPRETPEFEGQETQKIA
jgi:hypothetical protein